MFHSVYIVFMKNKYNIDCFHTGQDTKVLINTLGLLQLYKHFFLKKISLVLLQKVEYDSVTLCSVEFFKVA